MLSRLSGFTLKWIVSILVHSEKSGKWDTAVGITIIVLLAKGDGTYRPIGLLPLLPKVWMRTRKIYATAWERANDQDWVYAGVGKGADIAAWKQAARAELTDLMDWKTGYAQALLDLVKAFDRARTGYYSGKPMHSASRCGCSGYPSPPIDYRGQSG